MERITNGKVPYIKAFAKSYGDRWGRGGYGQVKVSEIPNIHSYDDFKAYYDSVVPYSRGQYKGLKPFGRRGGHYHMKEDSFGIHVMYFISNQSTTAISVWKHNEIWIRNINYSDSNFKTHVDHLFHFDLEMKWNPHADGMRHAPYMNIVHNGRTYFTHENETYIKFKRLDFKEYEKEVSGDISCEPVYYINTNSWGKVTKNAIVIYECLNSTTVPRLTLNRKKKNALLKRHEHLKKYVDTFLPLLCQSNKHSEVESENVSDDELIEAIKKYKDTHGDVDLTQNNVDTYSDLLHCIVGTIEKERAGRNSWNNPNAPITFTNFVGDFISILRANEIIDEIESYKPVTKTTKKYTAWLNL